MGVLGEDQRANLAALLRQGAPKSYDYRTDPKGMKSAVNLGGDLVKGYDKLKEKGDGSAFEGLKSTLGMGNPDLYTDNYNAEFGKYDPQFQATMPKDPNAQTGMFGGLGNQFNQAGNTMSGWFK
jgi:hypothetical protein